MENDFGELLRRARKTKKLSQTDLANKVRAAIQKKSKGSKVYFDQTRLSSWEVGRQRPDIEDKGVELILESLASQLDIPLNELKRVLSKKIGSIKTLNQEEYFSTVKSYLNDCDKDLIDLWFIGPYSLPILSSESSRKEWIENLSTRKINYNVIWLLDFTEPEFFRTLIGTASSIAKLASQGQGGPGSDRGDKNQRPYGKIINYAIKFKKDNQDLASKDEDYNKVIKYYGNAYKKHKPNKNAGEDGNNSRIEFNKELTFPWKEYKKMLYYWFKFGSIVLFEPEDITKLPVASVALKNVCLIPGGDSVDTFLFFDRKGTEEILSFVKSIKDKQDEDKSQSATSEENQSDNSTENQSSGSTSDGQSKR